MVATVGATTAYQNQSAMITSGGLQISSIFDGIKPNEQVKEFVVPKITPSRSSALLTLRNPALGNLGVIARPNAGCPVGGICAQPCTASAPGEFCEDPSGCGVDVSNQQNTLDFSQGTLEELERKS
jgi:hypothetical protein